MNTWIRIKWIQVYIRIRIYRFVYKANICFCFLNFFVIHLSPPLPPPPHCVKHPWCSIFRLAPSWPSAWQVFGTHTTDHFPPYHTWYHSQPSHPSRTFWFSEKLPGSNLSHATLSLPATEFFLSFLVLSETFPNPSSSSFILLESGYFYNQTFFYKQPFKILHITLSLPAVYSSCPSLFVQHLSKSLIALLSLPAILCDLPSLLVLSINFPNSSSPFNFYLLYSSILHTPPHTTIATFQKPSLFFLPTMVLAYCFVSWYWYISIPISPFSPFQPTNNHHLLTLSILLTRLTIM